MAALGRFLSKSAEKSIPFFGTLKKVPQFQWTSECQAAFEELKKYLLTPQVLAKPIKGEKLYLYLGVSPGAISSVLLREEGDAQRPIYYVSRTLRDAELRYSVVEKTILAVVNTVKKLNHYFQAHEVEVRSHQPLSIIISNPTASNRVIKWSVYLSKYQIEMKPRAAIKAQALADFMVECTARDNNPIPMAEQGEWWTLSTDGSSAAKACGGGVVIQSPEGFRSYHAIKFQFKVSNNETEHEALLSGLRLILNLKAEYVWIRCDSRLVVSQIKGEFDTKEERMRLYKEAALELLKILKGYELVQIPRAENTEADVLSKLSNDSPEHISKMAHIEDLGSPSIHVQLVSVVTEEASGWILLADHGEGLCQARQALKGMPNFPEHSGKTRNQLLSHQLVDSLCSLGDRLDRSDAEGTRAPSKVFIPTWREENYEAKENEETMAADLNFVEERRERAFLRAENYRRQVKEYYDRKVRAREFRVRDLVLRKREASQPTEGGEFAKSYEGPYKVTAVLRPGTYKLSTLEGRELGRHWNTHNLISFYM
ncbi:unnamed protein product [Cuscuta campestris]|uniref:Uncharacterized protein n=1 Tax=Cuscuta campestris TaxID=132261 RepID=A0A484M5M1_9ASTE|nr:unnamed protein product [Cuscuta campestris]